MGKCSLASYSETQSFRDALKGRSMEDAMSGPVDRDTSSYGDRSASSASGNNLNQSQSPMMVAIPVNGNLDDIMQQQQQTPAADEQQKSEEGGSSGTDLERESALTDSTPIPETTSQQQKMMEQRSGRQVAPMVARPAGAAQKPAGTAKSQRQIQQQRPVTNYSQPQAALGGTKGSGSNSETGFGDDQQTTPATASIKRARRPSQGPQQQQRTLDAGLDQQRQVSDVNEQQQQAEAPQQEQSKGGYGSDDQGLAAKQRAVAAMLMSMSNGMKQAQAAAAMQPSNGKQENSADNKKPGSSMAYNMLMSLANKAAYLGMQQQRQQTTAAPMQVMIPENSSTKRANQQMNGRQMSRAQQDLMGANRSATGITRTAYEPKQDKKMSPSMVNAMLNKMLMMQGEQQPKQTNYDATKQSAIAMLMKSPVGAEMLANLMMNSAPTQGSGKSASVGATAGMPVAKREQYKRMMMATALMQQQQQAESIRPTMEPVYNGDQQQQQDSPTFGRKQTPWGSMASRGYSANVATTTLPVAMMMGMLDQDAKEQQQQVAEYEQDQPMVSAPSVADRLAPANARASRPPGSYDQASYGMMAQPARQKGALKRASSGPANKPTGQYPAMSPMEMMMMMNNNNNRAVSSMADEAPKYSRNSGDLKSRRQPPPPPAAMRPNSGDYSSQDSMDGPSGQQQQMMMATLMAKMKGGNNSPPMNGFRQAFNQQAQEQQRTTDVSSSDGVTEYPSDGSMARPASSFMAQSQMDENADQPMGLRDTNDDNNSGERQQYDAAPRGQAEPFAFDYKVEDPQGNGHYRKEESDKNGVVRGSYGYTDVSGIYRHVEYVADEKGFRANIKSNEPGLNGSSGIGAAAGGSRSVSENGDADGSVTGDADLPTGNRQSSSSSSALANSGPSMDTRTAAGGDSQQQQQQQMMMMPAQEQQQQELNENGEK